MSEPMDMCKGSVKVAMEQIVDLSDMSVAAEEILCRESPYPKDIDSWTMFYRHLFCSEKTKRKQVKTAFNVDTRHIENKLIWLEVERFINEVDAANWIVEWTEHKEGNHEKAAGKLCRLARGTGVAISIDDVGDGQDGLSRMEAIECAEWVKIDGKLLHHARNRNASRCIIGGICKIAHEMGSKVVAEWTETIDDIRLAKELGADYAQGFFFLGHP